MAERDAMPPARDANNGDVAGGRAAGLAARGSHVSSVGEQPGTRASAEPGTRHGAGSAHVGPCAARGKSELKSVGKKKPTKPCVQPPEEAPSLFFFPPLPVLKCR